MYNIIHIITNLRKPSQFSTYLNPKLAMWRSREIPKPTIVARTLVRVRASGSQLTGQKLLRWILKALYVCIWAWIFQEHVCGLCTTCMRSPLLVREIKRDFRIFLGDWLEHIIVESTMLGWDECFVRIWMLVLDWFLIFNHIMIILLDALQEYMI